MITHKRFIKPSNNSKILRKQFETLEAGIFQFPVNRRQKNWLTLNIKKTKHFLDFMSPQKIMKTIQLLKPNEKAAIHQAIIMMKKVLNHLKNNEK